MDMYNTYYMLESFKKDKPINSFLRDTFFPTAASDIFTTEKVIVDYENNTDNKLAPGVVKGSVPVQRDSFVSKEYTAPLIAPDMSLSVDQLNKRTFGESLVSGMSGEERALNYLLDDLAKLNRMITNTEEHMCASILTGNAFSVNQYLNGYSSKYQEFSIDFYGEGNSSNQDVYSTTAWSTSSTAILSDIAAMCKMLKKKGLAADTVILGESAADVFMRNEYIIKLLDNRRYQIIGSFEPEDVGAGVTHLGRINALGNMVDVYAYNATYTNAAGTDTYYIPTDYCIVTSKGMGRTAYGAITQYEEGETDPTTYAEARVPHVVIDRNDNDRKLVLQSRPLPTPKRLHSAITADVL